MSLACSEAELVQVRISLLEVLLDLLQPVHPVLVLQLLLIINNYFELPTAPPPKYAA